MESMTITEALAELKLITKKVEKKKEVVKQNLTTFEHLPDAFKEDGGVKEMVKREMQAIADHYERLVRIRASIGVKNAETSVMVEGVSKTISQWLAWKESVKDPLSALLAEIQNGVNTAVKSNAQRPMVTANEQTKEVNLAKLMINVDMGHVNKSIETIISITEKLDGQLSLKNATTVVTF